MSDANKKMQQFFMQVIELYNAGYTDMEIDYKKKTGEAGKIRILLTDAEVEPTHQAEAKAETNAVDWTVGGIMNINLEIEKAIFDLDKEITGMSQDALQRLDLPHSFSIKSTSVSYDEGWRTGFRRCLAYVQQSKSKAEQGIRNVSKT